MREDVHPLPIATNNHTFLVGSNGEGQSAEERSASLGWPQGCGYVEEWRLQPTTESQGMTPSRKMDKDETNVELKPSRILWILVH